MAGPLSAFIGQPGRLRRICRRSRAQQYCGSRHRGIDPGRDRDAMKADSLGPAQEFGERKASLDRFRGTRQVQFA